jgi:hypothetical protein
MAKKTQSIKDKEIPLNRKPDDKWSDEWETDDDKKPTDKGGFGKNDKWDK